jgi:hypothetical protein
MKVKEFIYCTTGNNDNVVFLGCDAMYTHSYTPVFRQNVGIYLHLHGIITQKINITILTAMRTSNIVEAVVNFFWVMLGN